MAQPPPQQEGSEEMKKYWNFGNLLDEKTWQELIECRRAMENPDTLNRLVVNDLPRPV